MLIYKKKILIYNENDSNFFLFYKLYLLLIFLSLFYPLNLFVSLNIYHIYNKLSIYKMYVYGQDLFLLGKNILVGFEDVTISSLILKHFIMLYFEYTKQIQRLFYFIILTNLYFKIHNFYLFLVV